MSQEYTSPRVQLLGTVAEMTEQDTNLIKIGSLTDNEGLVLQNGQAVIGENVCTIAPPGTTLVCP